MSNILSALLDKVLMVECIYCGRLGEYACKRCFSRLFESYGEILQTQGLQGINVGFRYNPAIEHALKLGKHAGYFEIMTYLGKIWGKELIRQRELAEIVSVGYTFISVPMSREKLRLRGFNQVDLLLHGISQVWAQANSSKLCITALLARSVNTATQMGQNKAQREQKLASVFTYIGPDPPPARVIIVDDVYTTGSTLRECAKVLIEAGVGEVQGLILAKS